MKLAFVVFRYFPFGGLQRIFLDVLKTAVARHHIIDVYTMAWDGPRPDDVTFHLVAAGRGANHRRYQRFATAVQARLRRDTHDCVVGFNKMPGLDVYYACDPCFEEKARTLRSRYYRYTPRYRHFAAFERAVFDPGANTRLLMISEAEIPHFCRHYGTPASRFHLLPPGIAPDRLPAAGAADVRSEFRRREQLNDDDRAMLLIGSDFRRKGVDRIITGLASLPSAIRQRTRLYVLGEDNPKPFRRLAEQLAVGDRIRFTGGVSDVPRYLHGSDLLVHPARSENTGTVILEAMVAGLPVLVTANCGYARLVATADAGLVAPAPFEQAQFNALLRQILTSPQRPQWRDNALRYGRELMRHRYTEVACDLIEQTARAIADPRGDRTRVGNSVQAETVPR